MSSATLFVSSLPLRIHRLQLLNSLLAVTEPQTHDHLEDVATHFFEGAVLMMELPTETARDPPLNLKGGRFAPIKSSSLN